MKELDAAIRNTADPTRELWAAAAVRESFRAGDLLALWFNKHDEADAKLRQAALMTSLAIQDAATPAFTSDGADALRLPSQLRKRALEGLGVKLAQTALHAVSETGLTPFERMLRAMLDGEQMAVDMHDRGQLTALRVATGCAVAAGARPGITEAELDSKVQRLDLMLALGGADLHRFVGRETDLQILHQLWWNQARGVAIEGPGGTGKSLLVSRFVSDLLDSEPDPSSSSVWPSLRRAVNKVLRHKTNQQLSAVFHFDFDRRDLQGGSDSSSLDALTNELMRQARRWVAPAKLDKLLDSESDSFSYGLESQSYSRSTRNFRGRGGQITELAHILNRQSAEASPRILLIFDSMEQILGWDDEAANSVFHIAEQLEQGGTQPFIICVSRSFPSVSQIVERLTLVINLAQFSDSEARAYLTNEAMRSGIVLDDTALDRVIATVGCSPLALRLAISLMEKDKEAFDPKHWAKSLRDDKERIQASLYDRVLKRVRDKDLAKVARPGLLVRRLTSDVITRILAGPCEIGESEDLAKELMWKARNEGQLFSVNRGDPDPDALWHRADVRALMLPDLDTTIDETVARRINEAAIAFYSKNDDFISRTEELYHRLRLGQDAAELDARWIAVAGAALRNSLEELPPQSRTYVRRRLGGASVTAARAAVTASSADVELREVVRRELQAVADGADPMNTLANFGVDRMRGSLADLYAEALLSRGRLADLLAGAANLIATGDAPPAVLASVSNTAGGVLEGLGQLPEAFESWQAAIEVAPTNDEESIHIAVAARIGALRTARKQDDIRHFAAFKSSRARLIDETLSLARTILPGLSRRAVEAREMVAELSEPESGHVVPVELFRIFADLVRTGEAFPGLAERPARLSEIADGFGFQAASLREFSTVLSNRIYGDEKGRVIELMRDEVDWTIARAVGRTT
ncbi:hypothetical protein JN757_15090 [Pseudomonas granadensis]|uniref:Orc1-like AAA ATPase domain-containing protein n=1 Tax=Pseudomonas granadensis TaxID=1421430 RepID=A0ABX7G9M4_9PSED|nr:hypothetical protein [Pseudomonas granadensis]QRK81902.1 hypothetical protein JN757_15090 [Pseudomonas granadensis]